MYVAVSLLATLLICFPSVVNSTSYIIEMKNGRKLETSAYWKEGGEVKFYFGGGIVGISSGFIREIREVSGSIRPYTSERPIPPDTTRAPSLTPQDSSVNAGESGVSPKSKLDPKIIAGVMAFEERAQQINNMSRADLLKFADEGVALREQIVSSGQPYYEDPWVIKLYSLLELVKEAIDRKT